MKNTLRVILGPNRGDVWRFLVVGLLFAAIHTGLIAKDGDVLINASFKINELKGSANKLILTIVVKNVALGDVFLPTRNLGPLVTFGPDASAEFLFTGIPKLKNGGGYYIESECDFAPVVLKKGESALVSGSVEIAKSDKINRVTVTYNTAGDMLRRYKFDSIKLSVPAENESAVATPTR